MTCESVASLESAHLCSLAAPEQLPLHFQVVLEAPVRVSRLRVQLHYPFRGPLCLLQFSTLLLLALPELMVLPILNRFGFQFDQCWMYENSCDGKN